MLGGRSGRSGTWSTTTAPESCATLAFLVSAAALLFLCGAPLETDDTWWHLSLGRAFANEGPWLTADPILHASVRPPIPAAWLSDILLYHVSSLPTGLYGLRVLHVAIVAGILAAAWLALRRAGGSIGLASFAASVFLLLSAYRLTQLRPELATLLSSLLLYSVLLQKRSQPSWWRVGASAVLCGLWANLHPAFLLGPFLIAGAAAGIIAERWLRRDSGAPRLPARAIRLGWAALLGLGATFVNPLGNGAHLLFLRAGAASPELSVVVDEWSRLDPFHWPPANLPPGPLGWLAYMLLSIATLMTIGAVVRLWHQGEAEGRLAKVDGALAALALIGVIAPLYAVRFLWLSFFPLLLLVNVAGQAARDCARLRWSIALATLLLIPTSHQFGQWRLLSSGISTVDYGRPYHRWKYHDHAVHFLRETGLEGNLYNPYSMGGFLGYWLAPRLKTFIDGSLNVPPSAMQEYFAIQANSAEGEGGSATSRLDHYAVDVYLGIGFPTLPPVNRPWRYTTRHLLGDPDWILVYRDMRSAIYLRRHARNAENLERVRAYYDAAGIFFDSAQGLDVARLIDESPIWAAERGLVPRDFERRLEAARNGESILRAGLGILSATYLSIDLDERARRADATLIDAVPTAPGPRSRMVGGLLRLGLVKEALHEARSLARLTPNDQLSHFLIEEATIQSTMGEAERRLRVSRMPVFSPAMANMLRHLQASAPPLLDQTLGDDPSFHEE